MMVDEYSDVHNYIQIIELPACQFKCHGEGNKLEYIAEPDDDDFDQS